MNGVRGWFQIFRLNPDGRSDMSSSNETNNTRVCALPNNLPVCSVEEQVRGIREGNMDKSLAIKVDKPYPIFIFHGDEILTRENVSTTEITPTSITGWSENISIETQRMGAHYL